MINSKDTPISYEEVIRNSNWFTPSFWLDERSKWMFL